MGKNDFEITVKNCRNIKTIKGGNPITIKKNCLNILYGRNGMGKSTIGLAIKHAFLKSDDSLKLLESYDYKDSTDPAYAPEARCATRIKGLHIFNEQWVNSHCFTSTSLQSEAYELYVKDSEVRKLEKRRREKLGLLTKALHSEDTEALRKSLSALQKGLGTLKSNGEFKATAPVVKAFINGVPTEPVPNVLATAIKGMTAKEKSEWISWHKRHPSLRNEDVCPYCGYEDANRQNVCRQYDESRGDTEVKQWAAIANMHNEIGSRLSRSNKALLGKILNSKTPPTTQEISDLAILANEATDTSETLSSLSSILEDEEYLDTGKLIDALCAASAKLASCSLFLKTSQRVKTPEQKSIDSLIRAIDSVVSVQADLDTVSQDLVRKVASNITGHEIEINGFLAQCGYPYEIKIKCNPQTSETSVLLIPAGTKRKFPINNPSDFLSYGERNALALALFMFEALNDPQSLVVLDDPISSFDFDKRYGILYALFSENGGIFKQNLNRRTVLVMTHDFLVVSDLINIPGTKMPSVKGNLLTCADGVLSCQPLMKESIAPYTQIVRRKIIGSSSTPMIIRLVYIRQLCEMLRKSPADKSNTEAWTFNLLSGIIHAHSADKVMKDNNLESREGKWVTACENYIAQLTGEKFSYWKALETYRDCMPLLISEYNKPDRTPLEKLILIRLMIMRDSTLGEGSNIMKRFADETCHIGGSYLFQLDGDTYNQIPFYVTQWCDDVVAKAASKTKSQDISN